MKYQTNTVRTPGVRSTRVFATHTRRQRSHKEQIMGPSWLSTRCTPLIPHIVYSTHVFPPTYPPPPPCMCPMVSSVGINGQRGRSAFPLTSVILTDLHMATWWYPPARRITCTARTRRSIICSWGPNWPMWTYSTRAKSPAQFVLPRGQRGPALAHA